MHEMLTIVLMFAVSVMPLKSAAVHAVYAAGSFGAAFAKCLWPLVYLHTKFAGDIWIGGGDMPH